MTLRLDAEALKGKEAARVFLVSHCPQCESRPSSRTGPEGLTRRGATF